MIPYIGKEIGREDKNTADKKSTLFVVKVSI